jgi:hypothetical protein
MARSYIRSHTRSYIFDHSGHIFPITSYGKRSETRIRGCENVAYFQSHKKRNLGHKNVTKDEVEFKIYGEAVPLLPESVLPHPGIPTAGMHGTEIRFHIIRVNWRPSGPAAWSLGKTDTCQKHSSLEVSPETK